MTRETDRVRILFFFFRRVDLDEWKGGDLNLVEVEFTEGPMATSERCLCRPGKT
jgi:hypothetical protein